VLRCGQGAAAQCIFESAQTQPDAFSAAVTCCGWSLLLLLLLLLRLRLPALLVLLLLHWLLVVQKLAQTV
jgi:hypothetical protein